MEENKNLENIVLENKTIIKINDFIGYGMDSKYFAVAENKIYHKSKNNYYKLLTKDYKNN